MLFWNYSSDWYLPQWTGRNLLQQLLSLIAFICSTKCPPAIRNDVTFHACHIVVVVTWLQFSLCLGWNDLTSLNWMTLTNWKKSLWKQLWFTGRGNELSGGWTCESDWERKASAWTMQRFFVHISSHAGKWALYQLLAKLVFDPMDLFGRKKT